MEAKTDREIIAQYELSEKRSIMHYIAWLWLLGENEFDNLMDDYSNYGKPQLRKIEKYFGINPITKP